MPDDIVERLRSYEVGNLALQETWVAEIREAAAEIERLRSQFMVADIDRQRLKAEIEQLEQEAERRLDNNGRMRVALANAQSEIKRLRTELETVQKAWYGRCVVIDELAAEIERLRVPPHPRACA